MGVFFQTRIDDCREGHADRGCGQPGGTPLNGAGIHTAMESAYVASYVALQALSSQDYSVESMRRYETLWNESKELDRRTGELIATIAKNPHLKEFYLFFLNMVSRLTKEDANFKNFCGGIFSGVLPASRCLSPYELLNAAPVNPEVLLKIFKSSDELTISNLLNHALSVIQSTVKMSGRVISDPLANIGWGVETMTKTAGLMECYLKEPSLSAARERNGLRPCINQEYRVKNLKKENLYGNQHFRPIEPDNKQDN